MASFQNNQISIIGQNKTVQKTNLERKYKISNQAALHLLCQHGKKIKYLQQWCSAEIWIPHTEDWKFDDHIERDVIIRGTTEEDVENTETSTKIVHTCVRPYKTIHNQRRPFETLQGNTLA